MEIETKTATMKEKEYVLGMLKYHQDSMKDYDNMLLDQAANFPDDMLLRSSIVAKLKQHSKLTEQWKNHRWAKKM